VALQLGLYQPQAPRRNAEVVVPLPRLKPL
jgi:hypothetical protein